MTGRADPPADDASERHRLRMFDSAAVLAAEVSRVLGIAMDQGHGVVSIATRAQQKRIDRQLAKRGISVEESRHVGQYAAVDADALLSRVLVDGLPDPVILTNVLEALLDPLQARHPRVVIFGEVVSVLWERGEVDAAVSLERLLTQFVEARPVILHCAWPARIAGEPERAELFHLICAEHCRELQEDDLRNPGA